MVSKWIENQKDWQQLCALVQRKRRKKRRRKGDIYDSIRTIFISCAPDLEHQAESFCALAQVIQRSRKLQRIYLRRVGCDVVSAVCDPLNEIKPGFATQSIALDICREIRHTDWREVRWILPKLFATRISSLYLSNMKHLMEPEDFKILAHALKGNTSLVTLDLGVNSMGAAGAAALAGALKTNSCLQNLSLPHNGLGDEGVSVLAEALKVNSTLLNLDIISNHVGDEGLSALQETLLVNSSILSIALTELHSDGQSFHGKAICAALDRNKELSLLKKWNDRFSDLELHLKSLILPKVIVRKEKWFRDCLFLLLKSHSGMLAMQQMNNRPDIE